MYQEEKSNEKERMGLHLSSRNVRIDARRMWQQCTSNAGDEGSGGNEGSGGA